MNIYINYYFSVNKGLNFSQNKRLCIQLVISIHLMEEIYQITGKYAYGFESGWEQQACKEELMS